MRAQLHMSPNLPVFIPVGGDIREALKGRVDGRIKGFNQCNFSLW